MRVTILDCDFGDGDIEARILAEAGHELVLSPSDIDECWDLRSEAILTQYRPISAALVEANPSLRAVVRYGVGLDVIDLTACDAAGIAVAEVADYCTEEVADHAIALMLSIVRSVVEADSQVKNGGWPAPQDLPPIRRLRGRTLGLIGMGRIASAVAYRASAFGVEVRGYDPYLSPDEIKSRGVHPSSLQEALGSDIVSLHAPLLEQTRHLIDSAAIDQMIPGAILLNVARGGLVDQTALRSALDAGRIAWAGLDVFDEERLDQLALHPRVVATPHIAYFSDESVVQLRVEAARKVISLLGNSIDDELIGVPQ
jgi:D-3-phosphoglycerate dehydrogenase